ncbi:hypothetical protein HALLA_14515 [Halostagnicola larsenii XH-48]|uniref:DUF7993 domain-containing protein n=1 Tax=Halostagnicola larsenii XH-48 TaxID=797299 RepID=W0JRD2_9EURY|nr:hypothetical protein [Halostagnicola larsenii]AHF99821.1 hypothetical protein HALLA_14515 [Halostagnicola larsenii XH-48]
MVEARITDGRRIAELLASELDGREDGHLERLAVVDADTDVEPTADGARAYDIERARPAGGGALFARVFVHEDRTRVEFERGQERAADAAEAVGLRVRPKATTPPKTLVFVEDGGEVKRATDVFDEVSRSLEE